MLDKKDWTGNHASVHSCIGARNFAKEERQKEDYYATDPWALDVLISEGGQIFYQDILEPAAGQGHLSKRLQDYGYNVTSFDIIDRGFCPVKDFFEINTWHGDILTNPPYKYAQDFVEHALDIIPDGRQVIMFLKLTFLEGQKRKPLFSKHPPKYLYVSSSRLSCAKNGIFTGESSAVAYGWFVWEKGFKGDTIIKWIN